MTAFLADLRFVLSLLSPSAWRRDCVCDPAHLELGGFDRGCPDHDSRPPSAAAG